MIEFLIVNYNTRELLARCLDSIYRTLGSEARIAVLDNGSSDESAAMVAERYPQVRLVASERNLGFARGNNLLAETSKADFLLLLNSDTEIHMDVVSPMLDALTADPAVSVVAPRLVYPSGEPQFSSEDFPNLVFELARRLQRTSAHRIFGGAIDAVLDRHRHTVQTRARVAHLTEVVWATCWLLAREDVVRFELFDEHFSTYDEDLDFCRRLHRRGGKALYLPTAEVVHLGGASSTSAAKQRLTTDARAKYYARHHGRLQALLFRLIVVITDGLRRIKRGVSGRSETQGFDG